MHVNDIHSFSRPEEIIVKHLDLELNVNFEKSELSGKAVLQIENLTSADTLFLDTRDLVIERISTESNDSVSYILGDEIRFLGRSLSIPVEPNDKTVTVYYRTVPGAAALQWLQPEQTAGGKYPFLFTQSQAILARTWIPLQDSPSVRFTYKAKITVPKGLMAVMSAENDTALHADGVFTFTMPQAIPSYLMALSVGNFQFHPYDHRSGIFAEPATLPAASNEFTDMPAMITAAEKLYGKYAWGRYDVLVLPPSFPFGGMENPRVTFATPTIIAGDRSLVSLIAHELAHSWSGNLVTNATWSDFWLNEGFTVYFESRIMEELYGKPYADMMTVLSMNELKHTVQEMGEKNPETQLKLPLEGKDPDDGVTDIAYEKGRFFLLMLERHVGRETWDVFVKNYFAAHAFTSLTTEAFLEYLDKNLLKGDKDLKNKLKIEEWIYQPGLPSNFPVVESSELTHVTATVDEFNKGKDAAALNTNGWTTHHWLYFLRNLQAPLTITRMKNLDAAFHFTQSGNSEILCQWLQLTIASGYHETDVVLENFLVKVGRRKFVKPLFAALLETPEGRKQAEKIYLKARPGYHTVTSATIDAMMQQ